MQQNLGRRLVLFPLPLHGHQNPMLELAQILYSKGFSISIIHTHFNSPNSASYPHFTFHPVASTSFNDETASSDHVVGLVGKLNIDLVAPFKDVLLQIMSKNHAAAAADDDESVACLITDAMWYFTQDVADSLSLPRIVLRTSNPSSFVSFTCLSLLRDKGYLSAQGNQLEETVPELSPLKVKDITILCTRDREAAYELVLNLMEKTTASKGIVFNTYEELECSSLSMIRNDLATPIFAFGPFHKQVPISSHSSSLQDISYMSWLNSQAPKSVLYVSFGSIISIDKEEFLEIAWGLLNSKQPFLWVVRAGLVRGSNGLDPLPNGFLDMVADRGRIIKWAPQKEVLGHYAIGGFWTHCGWNSTLESICEGVPMLCLPAFGDQRTNARYVSDVWRVGLQLENEMLRRQEIKKAIRRLMIEDEGREIRERITSLKEKANLCVVEGGSSFKSLDKLVTHILSF